MIDSVSPQQQVDHGTAVDEDFLALICSDEEFLRAEFDSIIAAAWGSRSRFRPRPAPPPPQGIARPARADGTQCLTRRPQQPGADEWARQRSPPPRFTWGP
jgi:hypothetical protein